MGSTSRFSCVVRSPPHRQRSSSVSASQEGSRSPFLLPMEVCYPGKPLSSTPGHMGWGVSPSGRASGLQNMRPDSQLVQTGVPSLIFTQASLYVVVAELVLHSPSTTPVLARILGCWQGLSGLFNGRWGCCLPHVIYCCSGSQSLNRLSYFQCFCHSFICSNCPYCMFKWGTRAEGHLPGSHGASRCSDHICVLPTSRRHCSKLLASVREWCALVLACQPSGSRVPHLLLRQMLTLFTRATSFLRRDQVGLG